MAHHPPPGAAGGEPRTPLAPAPPQAQRSAPCVTYVQKCVVLVDWWLERVEGEDGKIRVAGFTDTAQTRQGASSSKGNKTRAVRVFKSAAISRRYDYFTIETADGNLIKIGRLLNIPQTRDNGFPQEVCECFELGFPVEWERLANPNMEQMNGQARSPSKSTASAPSGSVECCMEKLLCGSIINSIGYTFAENDFNSSRRSTSNTDGHLIQRLSNLSNGNTDNRDSSMGKMAASEGLGDGRMDMPEGPLTCSSGQADDQHESMQIDASEQEIVNRFISSVLAKQSKGSICSYSKVDGKSKIAAVEKEGHRSRVGCGQAEHDEEIHDENMHSCSGEQEMVTHPIDSTVVNICTSVTSSDLKECGTPKRGKASVNLGTANALEVPSQGMTPQFGAVRGSEDNTVRRLRSGKVFGVPSSAPTKRGYMQKRMQHEASNEKMVPNEGVTPTADLTSHGNGCSVAGIVSEDKLKSHDSCRKGRERPAKTGRGRQANRRRRAARNESKKLFWNWL